MSGDVQPRKRKDKRKKKGSMEARRLEEYSEESAIFRRQSSAAQDEEEILHHHTSSGGSEEVIHVHKENKLGGNICSKIIFFGLLGALGIMVGLIIIEYHGTSDVETQSAADSPWSVMLEGWVDDPVNHNDHDDHDHEMENMSHEEEEEEDHDEHSEHEGEHSEVEHEEEEEVEEDVEDASFVKQTYEDLRAAYNQITPEESDTELTDDPNLKSDEYGATESEPEPSETEEEEEEEEEEVKEDDPLGQWKSESAPELLAEEVEEVQTGSETEEESDSEALPIASKTGGPKSNEVEEIQASQDFTNEEIVESTEKPNEPDAKVEAYENADITNQGDWEIREDLDEADRDLDEGDFPV